MFLTSRLNKVLHSLTAFVAVLGLTCQLAEAQVKPFTVNGAGVADFIPFVEFNPGGNNDNSQAFHSAVGEATELGTYYGEGKVQLDLFTGPTTAAFSSAVPFVFTAIDGDKLAFTYGDTSNGAAQPGEVVLSDGGAGNSIATFTAEFNPVIEQSTGRFKDVIGGSFVMIAVTEPFQFGTKPVGGVAYTWDGKGTIEFKPVPEPSSIALMVLGAVGVLGRMRRHQQVV